ncbi:hypothetical protein AMS68_000806 [Peltaster fructicola]|uniref:NACHT domain-containing protein n=1 Tax=Peltaster fructicola TaxID=286661 RepID=A0A6H0XKY7_9PEZI|nr:hypothetical protein AMS68_000806 [Peltaster fructicola]
MDPWSAGGALLEAIKICHSLMQYYQDVRDATKELKRTFDRIESLSEVLISISNKVTALALDDSVTRPAFKQFAEDLTALKKRAKKIRSSPETPSTLKDKARRVLDVTCYPLSKGTLGKLQDCVDRCERDLALALKPLELQVSHQHGRSLEDISSSIKHLQISQEEQGDAILGAFSNIEDLITAQLARLHDSSSVSHNAAKYERLRTEYEPVDPYVDHNRVRSGSFLEESGRWFLESAEYQKWKLGDLDTRLSVYGAVGCCKTSLCSTIIEDLRSSTHNAAAANVFFYITWQHGRYSYESILRSAIFQLAARDTIKNIITTWLSPKLRKDVEVSELERLFGRCTAELERVYLVVDGLDECPDDGDQRSDLLEGLLSLASMPRVRCLTFSRPYPDIERVLHDGAFVSYTISGADINKDIACWLDNRLAKAKDKYKPACQTLIKESLVQKASGMFQWATCLYRLVDRSQAPSLATVRLTLQQLPKDLYTTYDKILENMLHDQSIAIKALWWLAFANRPLMLHELTDACIIDPTAAPYLDDDRRPSIDGLRAVIAPLTRVVTIKPLLSPSITGWNSYAMTLVPSISRAKVGYRSPVRKLGSTHINRVEKDEGGFGTPLIAAASHGYDETVAILLAMGAKVDQVAGKYGSALQIAAVKGHKEVVRMLIDHGATIDLVAPDSRYGCALVAACANDNVDIVELLLAKGANPNIQTTDGQSALHELCCRANTNLMTRLLLSGADPHIQSSTFGPPAYEAIRRAQKSSLELLTSQGYRFSSQHPGLGTALQHAVACSCDVGIIELLIANGASLDERVGTRLCPLLLALHKEDLTTATLLITKGAETRISDDDGATVSTLVAALGNTELSAALNGAISRHNAAQDDRSGSIIHVA